MMPIKFTLDDDKIGVFTTIGNVEYEDGMKVLHLGLDTINKECKNHLILFDIRQSEENRSGKEIKDMAETIKQQLGSAKMAIVVDNDFYHGVSRMFIANSELLDMDSNVFRNPADAVSWLKNRD